MLLLMAIACLKIAFEGDKVVSVNYYKKKIDYIINKVEGVFLYNHLIFGKNIWFCSVGFILRFTLSITSGAFV